MSKDGHITKDGWKNYKEILHETSALKRNFDPNEKYSTSSKGLKWKIVSRERKELTQDVSEPHELKLARAESTPLSE